MHAITHAKNLRVNFLKKPSSCLVEIYLQISFKTMAQNLILESF